MRPLIVNLLFVLFVIVLAFLPWINKERLFAVGGIQLHKAGRKVQRQIFTTKSVNPGEALNGSNTAEVYVIDFPSQDNYLYYDTLREYYFVKELAKNHKLVKEDVTKRNPIYLDDSLIFFSIVFKGQDLSYINPMDKIAVVANDIVYPHSFNKSKCFRVVSVKTLASNPDGVKSYEFCLSLPKKNISKDEYLLGAFKADSPYPILVSSQ